MNIKMIINTLGLVLKIEAACMVLPLICALCYMDIGIPIFLACIVICLIWGQLFCMIKPEKKVLHAKEGFVTVALSWILISIFGCLPFLFSGYVPNIVDAIFETASGFTTTGASILKDVEVLPKSLIFWRSFTHWIGGMGVLVFLVALLPSSGGNMHLIKAESPGPAVSKLVPKVRQTAKILYAIYIGLTLLEIVLLLLGGLNLFESLTLSFGTAGTGGFAILNSGIGDYSSYVQIVITIFMLLFGVDFSIYYLILLRRVKDVLHSEEVRVYFGIVITAIVLISVNCYGLFENLFETIKHSAFQVAAVITTTGYSTADFNLWPSFSKTILVVLMFFGACAGSTGGGIKISRIMILFKSVIREIKMAAHPRITKKITMNGKLVGHETIRGVNVFMMAYLGIYAVTLLIISLDNFDFTTNFTAIVATLNNIGPGLEAVGPTQNFSGFSNISKLVLSLNMIIGRLEIFPFLVLVTPFSWKK